MAQIIQAASSEDLLAKLACLDIAVMPRSKGRTKLQTERFSIAHLLATLPAEFWAFPLTLEHADRPDFVVTFDGQTIGVEVTEAVPENVAHASVLRQAGIGPDVYFIPRALPGEPRKTKAELCKEIKLDPPGQPWEGNAPEREWADAMFHFTLAKVKRAQRSGYTLHSRNWLLIYDNWPLPSVRREEASAMFAEKCIEADVHATFERVFVLDSETLCEVGFAVKVHHVRNPRDVA